MTRNHHDDQRNRHLDLVRVSDQNPIRALAPAPDVLERGDASRARYRTGDALRLMARFCEDLGAASDRDALDRIATAGVRRLLRCGHVHLLEEDPTRRALMVAAADPPLERCRLVLSMARLLDANSRRDQAGESTVGRQIGQELRLAPDCDWIAAPFGPDGAPSVLLAARADRFTQHDVELLHLAGRQIGVATDRVEAITRLNDARSSCTLFEAIDAGDLDRADDSNRGIAGPHVFVHARPARHATVESSWASRSPRVENALRSMAREAFCDSGASRDTRALLSLGAAASTPGALTRLNASLRRLGAAENVVIGAGRVRGRRRQATDGVREAADAAQVAWALLPQGGMLRYRDLGPYKYLVRIDRDNVPADPHRDAIRRLMRYDETHASELLRTLERYLERRCRVDDASRALAIHPNTLRTRLGRIEQLTALDLSCADVLALELALKITRLQAPSRSDD